MVRIIFVSLLLVGGVAFAEEQGVRLEPTGCPYGDSIPVDSDKCVAPVTEQPKPVENITPEQKLPSVGSDCK